MNEKIEYGLYFHFLLDELKENGCRDRKFTKAFCKRHNVDYQALDERLKSHDGFCDCEVLLNVVFSEMINGEELLPMK